MLLCTLFQTIVDWPCHFTILTTLSQCALGSSWIVDSNEDMAEAYAWCRGECGIAAKIAKNIIDVVSSSLSKHNAYPGPRVFREDVYCHSRSVRRTIERIDFRSWALRCAFLLPNCRHLCERRQ